MTKLETLARIWTAPVEKGEKMLLLALAWHCDEYGRCFPSQPQLAEMCGVNERTIQRCLKGLEGAGLVSVIRTFRDGKLRMTNRYALHLEGFKEKPVEFNECQFAGVFGPFGNPNKLHATFSTEPANLSDVSIIYNKELTYDILADQTTKTTEPKKEKKPRKPETNQLDPQVPGLNLDAWKDYVEYRRARRLAKYAKPERAAQKLVQLSNGCSETQQRIVDQTIENNWSGLFELKGAGRSSFGHPVPSPSPMVPKRGNDLLDALLKRQEAGETFDE
ncbi:helix-turn-helix domain-containing protein [Ferrimonas balearica]|uniref:helix-turn-helix domain-containing protein n=1 Tax=Ferrimonas balearica TaxID=44012 RepID=UPI001C951045|nr:helix-turn-helix domain-containing protein [Ferrimonas balearica]MBY6104984.1 helix-turn-helix domain-containing protein [Ferrimonas balearica]